MVDRIPSVDSSTLQFPSTVRAVQAANLADEGTPEGAALAGVFVRKGAQRFNVVDYGADSTGANPTTTTTAIQDAVDAAVAAGGGVVFFPPGAFTVDDTISITSNVVVEGAGLRTTTVSLDSSADVNMFEIATTVVGFQLRSISLNGNNANNTSGSGVVFLDEPSVYRGSGVLEFVRIVDFADNGLHLGTRRSTAYLNNVISGGNGGYGIYLGQDSQDALIVSPNLGTNLTGGLYVNGSNNTMTGGTIYGSPNLIVLGTNASKFIASNSVLEESDEDGIVINISGTDDVNTAQFLGITAGQIGRDDPATYRLIKSSTAKRIVLSGHMYKRTADTAPSYLIDVPTTCVVDASGFLVQVGGFAAAFSANASRIVGARETTEVFAGGLGALAGSPVQAQLGGIWPVWLLDASSVESVGGTFRVPADWGSFAIEAVFANAGAGSGDFSARTVYGFHTLGEDATSSLTTGSTVVTTAGAQYVLQSVTLASGVTNTAGKALAIQVSRRAADVGDTLANDVGLSAIVLRRQS